MRRTTDISLIIKIAAAGLVLLICGLLLWRGAAAAQFSAANFVYPFQLDESESMIAAETLLLDSGQNIYQFPSPQQFVAAPYPPLYYLLNWPIMHFSGYSLKVGRAITLIFTLAAAALIFLLVRIATRRNLAALAAALAFSANTLTAFWGTLVKPDIPAMTFALLGLYLVARSVGQRSSFSGETGAVNRQFSSSQATSHNSKFMYLAAIAFALALLTKQTSVAAAGAGLLVLLLDDWRRGWRAVALYLGIAGGVSLLLNWQTAGGYWWHMVTVHALPWNFERMVSYVATVWSVNWPLVIMGSGGLLLGVFGQAIRFNGEAERSASVAQFTIRNSQFKIKLMLLLYALAACVQASGVGTLGGVHNHFLDALSAFCIGFGLLLGLLLDLAARPTLPLRLAGIGVGVVAAVFVWFYVTADYDPYDGNAYQLRPPSASQLEGLRNIAQFASNNGGLLYADNLSIILSAGRPTRTTDPYTQTHASSPNIHPNPKDRWDESELVADIRAAKFALIILRPDAGKDICALTDAGNGTVSPAIAQAVCARYKLIQRNVEYVYTPK